MSGRNDEWRFADPSVSSNVTPVGIWSSCWFTRRLWCRKTWSLWDTSNASRNLWSPRNTRCVWSTKARCIWSNNDPRQYVWSTSIWCDTECIWRYEHNTWYYSTGGFRGFNDDANA